MFYQLQFLLLVFLFSTILYLISTVVLPKEILGFISLLYFIKYKNSNLRYVAYLIYIAAVLSHEVNFIYSIPIFFILENKNNKTNFITINLFFIYTLIKFGGDIEKIQLLCTNNAVYDNNCYKALAISNSPKFTLIIPNNSSITIMLLFI